MSYLSHIFIMNALWGQNVCKINRLFILQKKPLGVIYFNECSAHATPPFFKSKITKLLYKIEIQNFLFISKFVNNKLPPI